MDEPNILTDCALFRGLRRAQIREMLPCLSARQARFRRGQFLLRAGDRASSAGIILSGEAEVLQEDFWGNRNLLDELCQNLCDNAIRYNRPGGKVQIVTACTRDGHCSLTVTDNGIGIPRESQSSVFERFYRVDKSRSKATGGTGLGLAIVKHIALIHEARIKLESQVDVGTTITVTFPTAS